MELIETPQVIKDIDSIGKKVPAPILVTMLHCMNGENMESYRSRIFYTLCNAISGEPIEIRHL